jgi:hypothetical protein
MQRRRSAAMLGGTLLAVLFAIQPAAAFQEIYRSGTVYEPQVTDESAAPGVTCIYENNPGASNDELDKIRIRQFFTHAPYAEGAAVGFQLQITRNTKPFNDNKFFPYQTTPLIRKMASESEVAFFDATWRAPEGVNARFRAVIKLYFYTPGSSSNVGGELRGRLEAYQHKIGSLSFVDGDLGAPGSCAPKYPGGGL